jgi:hypothetical protein
MDTRFARELNQRGAAARGRCLEARAIARFPGVPAAQNARRDTRARRVQQQSAPQ